MSSDLLRRGGPKHLSTARTAVGSTPLDRNSMVLAAGVKACSISARVAPVATALRTAEWTPSARTAPDKHRQLDQPAGILFERPRPGWPPRPAARLPPSWGTAG